MRSFAQFLLPACLLVPAVFGEDLAATCDDMGVGVWSACTATYNHPTGYKVKKCSDGVSTCGITAVTEKRYTCDQVRSGMGTTAAEAFFKKSDPICGCLTALKKISVHEHLYAIFEYGDVTSATSPVLVDAAHHIDRCVTDDLIFGDNRRAVIAQDISPSGSTWTAVRAKEADMDLYKKFLHVIQPCYKTECDRVALGDFFSIYIQDSDEIATGPFVSMVYDWVNLFADIKIKVAAIKSTAKGIQTRLKTVSTKVSSVKKSACVGTACKGKTATAFLKQISDTLAAVKYLEGAISVATKAENANTPIQSLNYMAINGAKYKPENDYLYSLFLEGKITEMGDLIWGFEVAKLMPQIAAKLKVEIAPIATLSHWSSHSTAASTKVKGVLSKNFKNHKDLSKTAAYRKVRDGFIAIQGSMKKELQDPLLKLTTQIKALDTALNKFPLRKKKLDWLVGSSSYKRWTANYYEMPCLVTMRQPYSYQGYSTYVDYPTFETCGSGPDLVYLPSHHIPWLKWRFIT